MPEQQGDVDALRERVAALEDGRDQDKLEIRNSVQADVERYREDVVKPRLAELESEIEELREELQEQREELNDITGPADGNPTKPEQRARAVRQMMKNQARARDYGTLAWDYNDVIDNLESNGHGKVYPTQAYRIMKEVGEAKGYAHTKDDDGNHSLRVSLGALPSNDAVNIVNNGSWVSEGEQTAQTTTEAAND